ncbi:MAG: hypothetical protein ABW278_08415 [Steroidobacteraceae bacterium]
MNQFTTVLLIGLMAASGAPNAGKTLRRRYTNGWMLYNGNRQLAFRHANNVPPPSSN